MPIYYIITNWSVGVLTNGFQAFGGRAWKASLYMRSGRKASAS